MLLGWRWDNVLVRMRVKMLHSQARHVLYFSGNTQVMHYLSAPQFDEVQFICHHVNLNYHSDHSFPRNDRRLYFPADFLNSSDENTKEAGCHQVPVGGITKGNVCTLSPPHLFYHPCCPPTRIKYLDFDVTLQSLEHVGYFVQDHLWCQVTRVLRETFHFLVLMGNENIGTLQDTDGNVDGCCLCARREGERVAWGLPFGTYG
jgi:hypothetical protein